LEEELEFFRDEQDAKEDTDHKSVQTNEFEDPFEKELFDQETYKDASFRYTMTDGGGNGSGQDYNRDSNFSYLTTNKDGSFFDKNRVVSGGGEN
jgi:thioredoxin reductase